MIDKDTDLVLVTGANGFIASWIVQELLAQGIKVRGTVRDPNNEKKVGHLKKLPGAAEHLELVSLDLNRTDQFDDVLKGVTLVAHTASPFPSKQPKDEMDLIRPAVNGTKGVLEAVVHAGSVRTVVLTSSVVAVGSGTALLGEPAKVRGESDWTNVDKAQAYDKSKTLAEKAAWDIWTSSGKKFTLCTINPSLVLGPMLSNDVGASAEIIQRIMNESLPLCPKLGLSFVDVRDVAHAHVLALQASPEKIVGRRFILASRSVWLADVAAGMKQTFGPMGYKIGTGTAPYAALWLLSFLDKGIAMILPTIGLFPEYDNQPSKDVLGISYIDMVKTLADGGHAAVHMGICKKKSHYKPPSADWDPVKSSIY